MSLTITREKTKRDSHREGFWEGMIICFLLIACLWIATKPFLDKELAQKCSMDAAIISEVERGGGVYNAAHINKIQNALGVKIPR